MSRGPGRIQQDIMGSLDFASQPLTRAELFAGVDTRAERNSIARALRVLEAAGKITRIKRGDVYRHRVGYHQAVRAMAVTELWTSPKTGKADDRRLPVAIHEAGHAVICLAGGQPVALVTIKPRATAEGYMQHVTRGPDRIGQIYSSVNRYRAPLNPGRDNLDAFGNVQPSITITDAEHEARIMCCIAGPMAEAIHKGMDASAWRGHASGTDMSNARYARRNLDKPKSWDEYERDTKALVEKFWHYIEAVAAALLERETLSGADVDDICQRSARAVVKRQHLNQRGRVQ